MMRGVDGTDVGNGVGGDDRRGEAVTGDVEWTNFQI
jgi:hypothetical protein